MHSLPNLLGPPLSLLNTRRVCAGRSAGGVCDRVSVVVRWEAWGWNGQGDVHVQNVEIVTFVHIPLAWSATVRFPTKESMADLEAENGR